MTVAVTSQRDCQALPMSSPSGNKYRLLIIGGAGGVGSWATPIKIARYVIYDDAIIAVGISTNDNDINNNYNKVKTKRTQESGELWMKSDRVHHRLNCQR